MAARSRCSRRPAPGTPTRSASPASSTRPARSPAPTPIRIIGTCCATGRCGRSVRACATRGASCCVDTLELTRPWPRLRGLGDLHLIVEVVGDEIAHDLVEIAVDLEAEPPGARGVDALGPAVA